jgi:oxygen-dependent protoporphyrinogen oxidase
MRRIHTVKRRIAIIGGGISGLTAAYVLQRDHASRCEFVLYETANRFGGTVQTVCRDGFTIECGPDSWVSEKPWAEQLVRELGLADELLPSNDHQRRTYIALGNRLVPLPDGMRMMVPTDLNAIRGSSLFSDEAKQAYLSEPRRTDELRATSLLARGEDADESVADFVRRHFGDEVTERVAGPLLAGVFGGDVEKLSARALLAPFVAIEAEYGSLILGLEHQGRQRTSKPVFTTLRSGLQTLVNRLVASLPPSTLCASAPVSRVHQRQNGWLVESAIGTREFDRVLLATPLDTTRDLLSCVRSERARQAAALLPSDATSSLIVALGYGSDAALPKLPSGFGLLVGNQHDQQSLLACTFVNQKFANRAPQRSTLLRVFFSSAAADTLSSATEEQIAEITRSQLSSLVGPLPPEPHVALVRSWPRSLPQYEVGHLVRMRELHEPLGALRGIAIAGNAMRGVGLPDLIRDADRSAQMLATD